jgi:hypothetical protein
VKTIPEPQGNKKNIFQRHNKACQKDVERAFGVLQSCFAIVRGLARLCDEDTLHGIMMACIIMHNMIIEDSVKSTKNNMSTTLINEGHYVSIMMIWEYGIKSDNFT